MMCESQSSGGEREDGDVGTGKTTDTDESRKNQVGTQVTLDDDFIILVTMSDADQMILSAGEIQLEPLKIQDGRVLVRGKLDFHVLYRREEGGMQTLGRFDSL